MVGPRNDSEVGEHDSNHYVTMAYDTSIAIVNGFFYQHPLWLEPMLTKPSLMNRYGASQLVSKPDGNHNESHKHPQGHARDV